MVITRRRMTPKAMAEPGTNQGETNGGWDVTRGGWVRQVELREPWRGRGAGRDRPSPEPSGHAIAGLGAGRSSKKGFVASPSA